MSVRQFVRLSAPGAALVALAAHPAAAHTGGAQTLGFAAGFLHPLAGLDHVLAMVAVGLLAALLGGRALLAVPGAFLGAMLIGGTLGWLGASLPLVEVAIVASVIVLGGMVTSGRRIPVTLATVLAAAFGLFHGHAHGTEMTAAASALSYGLGFNSATALLHAGGIASARLADWTAQSAGRAAVRMGGGAIAALGLVLVLV